MNRTLLALAVTAALAVPMTAQAAPTVYGLLNLSVDMVDVDNEAVEKLVIRTSPPSSTINYLNAAECTDFFLAFQPKYRF